MMVCRRKLSAVFNGCERLLLFHAVSDNRPEGLVNLRMEPGADGFFELLDKDLYKEKERKLIQTISDVDTNLNDLLEEEKNTTPGDDWMISPISLVSED